MQTGKLYIARTDEMNRWLSPKVACGGGGKSGVSTKTYGAPTPKETDCDAGPDASHEGHDHGEDA